MSWGAVVPFNSAGPAADQSADERLLQVWASQLPRVLLRTLYAIAYMMQQVWYMSPFALVMVGMMSACWLRSGHAACYYNREPQPRDVMNLKRVALKRMCMYRLVCAAGVRRGAAAASGAQQGGCGASRGWWGLSTPGPAARWWVEHCVLWACLIICSALHAVDVAGMSASDQACIAAFAYGHLQLLAFLAATALIDPVHLAIQHVAVWFCMCCRRRGVVC